jgi:hypothetical protein
MFGKKMTFEENAQSAYNDFLEEYKEEIAQKGLYITVTADAMNYDMNLERFEKEYGYRLQALGGNNLVKYFVFRKKEG